MTDDLTNDALRRYTDARRTNPLVTEEREAAMTDAPWNPSMPLRADATDEQIQDRFTWHLDHSPIADVLTAREFAEARAVEEQGNNQRLVLLQALDAQLAAAEAEVARLRAVLKRFEVEYDCDASAHRHGHAAILCRVCIARAALAEPRTEEADGPGPITLAFVADWVKGSPPIAG